MSCCIAVVYDESGVAVIMTNWIAASARNKPVTAPAHQPERKKVG